MYIRLQNDKPLGLEPSKNAIDFNGYSRRPPTPKVVNKCIELGDFAHLIRNVHCQNFYEFRYAVKQRKSVSVVTYEQGVGMNKFIGTGG